MRAVARWGALLLVAVAVVACDTDQPLQDEERLVEITIRATGATIDGYNVWDVFRDNDNNEQPDDIDGDGDGDTTLWCDGPRVDSVSGALIPFQASSVPWGFAIEISITREGQTTREALTSPAALALPTSLDTGNLTFYDSAVSFDNSQAAPPGHANPTFIQQYSSPECPTGIKCTNCLAGDTCRFRFGNARVLSSANLDLILSDSNLLHDFNPGLYGGVCPGVYLGPPRIDGDPQPYALTLDKGDTMHVQVRRLETLPPGISLIGPPPRISSSVVIDGRPLEEGTHTSDVSFGAGFSFSYTAR